jgi:hypothetical protein
MEFEKTRKQTNKHRTSEPVLENAGVKGFGWCLEPLGKIPKKHPQKGVQKFMAASSQDHV